MKVICTDNFDRETRSDTLVKTGLTPAAAKALADELNQKSGENGDDYYLAVPDDQALFIADLP